MCKGCMSYQFRPTKHLLGINRLVGYVTNRHNPKPLQRNTIRTYTTRKALQENNTNPDGQNRDM